VVTSLRGIWGYCIKFSTCVLLKFPATHFITWTCHINIVLGAKVFGDIRSSLELVSYFLFLRYSLAQAGSHRRLMSTFAAFFEGHNLVSSLV
jgi:hypothetical protein